MQTIPERSYKKLSRNERRVFQQVLEAFSRFKVDKKCKLCVLALALLSPSYRHSSLSGERGAALPDEVKLLGMAFNWNPPQKSSSGPAKRSATQCKACGGTDFDDFCESGDRACARCGTVLQENGIVSTVQFSESGGSSNVVGQFVSGDKGRPSGGAARGRGRFGHNRDSRDTTIQNGKKKIIQVQLVQRGSYAVSHTTTQPAPDMSVVTLLLPLPLVLHLSVAMLRLR